MKKWAAWLIFIIFLGVCATELTRQYRQVMASDEMRLLTVPAESQYGWVP